MTKTKLKPCPFCGGEATLTKNEKSGVFYVFCKECLRYGVGDKISQKAVEYWNARPIEDELDKKNGYLIDTCHDLHDIVEDFRAERDQKDLEIKRLREALELIAKAKFYFARGEEEKQIRRVCEIAEEALKGKEE